uniref:glycoside hydrolase family 99-like domain-containing protein n=1 Tax=uncultured Draconibacterium sp. TaxID=1573823 RepID=UPI0032162DCA
MKRKNKAGLLLFLFLAISACSSNKDLKNSGEEPPFEIPKGDVEVAVYYFPNWGPVYSSEWSTVKAAQPQFEGHQQPKVPMWGYANENDPENMAQKIDAAVASGIDAFIFDWYYYDEGAELLAGKRSSWDANKYLYMALEDGFLKAENNQELKFSIMWCNHNLGANVKGAVKPETFESLTDYVIENYFKHPSYWKIDGCPYFSIYEFHSFLETFSNDFTKAAEAIDTFRAKVKAAGFPDLHLNGVLWGIKGELLEEAVSYFNLNSTTSYVWIHHFGLPDFPSTEYSVAADGYFRGVEAGGAANGLENPASSIPVPYHINVSMGWDSSPRCNNSSDWMTRRDYPFGPVIVNNTPYLFKKYLAKAKALTLEKPASERVITINSWNEWGEGSYLEPDMINGMEYLNAVKEVFGSDPEEMSNQ